MEVIAVKESFLNYHFDHLEPKSEWLFVTPSLESHDLRIQVQELGHFFYDGMAFTERGPLESYQISICFNSTDGYYTLPNGKWQQQQAMEVSFLDCTGGYRVESNGVHNDLFVHFWGEDIAYYYKLFFAQNGGDPVVHSWNQSICDNLNRLMLLYRRPNDLNADILAEMLVMQMITELIRMVTPNLQNCYSEYVQRAIDIISDAYVDRLSLDDLASQVHISKFYLSHIFKTETGLSPASYLQQFRLNKAKELLRSTDLSQEEICSRVGFYNCSYLSRLFRLYENQTPDQYRKKWRQPANL